MGNYDSSTANGLPAGGGAYVYDAVGGRLLVPSMAYPGSVSNTASGIVWNGGTSSMICGGCANSPVNNLLEPYRPLSRALLVDFDSATQTISNWKSFGYGPSTAVASITHFEDGASPRSGFLYEGSLSDFGTAANALDSLGGIFIGPGTSATTLGGTQPFMALRVMYNGGTGVTIDGSSGNRLMGSEIRGNAGNGISLSGGRNNALGIPGAGNAVVENTLNGIHNTAGNVEISGATGIVYVP